MDGKFHKIDNNMTGQSAIESKNIDLYKDQLAIDNDVIIIRIDCEYPQLRYIQYQLLNSPMSKLFNLNNIDWIKCHEFACKSRVFEASNLWNEDIYSINEISKMMKLCVSTVRKYLKQASQIGICNYNAIEEKNKNYKNNAIRIKENTIKPVICLTTDKIYESGTQAERETGVYHSLISACCIGKRKYSGKLASGEPLRWSYYIKS